MPPRRRGAKLAGGAQRGYHLHRHVRHMASESQEAGETARPGGGGRRLRDTVLAAWMMAMLFAGGMLYPTVILPAARPVNGVLNAAGKPVGLDFVLFYATGSLARD